MLTQLFGLEEKDTLDLNDNLYYLGYQSTYFILNMGNIFLLLVLEFAIIIFIMLTQKSKGTIQGVHSQAKNLLIWNGIYKSLNEPYVVFVVSCMTQTLAMSWSSAGESANNVLMILTFFFVVCFPFWTFFLLRRNKERLFQKEFLATYSSIYEHLTLKTVNNWILLEPCISGFRTLLTIAALMYL
jgi:protein-S-isoprenylcysteine O-methyltransferase Ste14